jgi:hypothetical protein
MTTNNTKHRATTVRVLTHLTSDGQYAVGVVSSEWQGAVKVSRRLARLQPLVGPDWYPPGVDRDVYRAYLALAALLKEQSPDSGVAF